MPLIFSSALPLLTLRIKTVIINVRDSAEHTWPILNLLSGSTYRSAFIIFLYALCVQLIARLSGLYVLEHIIIYHAVSFSFSSSKGNIGCRSSFSEDLVSAVYCFTRECFRNHNRYLRNWCWRKRLHVYSLRISEDMMVVSLAESSSGVVEVTRRSIWAL